MLLQLPGDFMRLLYEPRRFLVARASAARGRLVRASLFLVFSQLAGGALILQEWPTASETTDFLVTAPIIWLLAAGVISLPLYVAWRIAGAPREYERVVIILLYQLSFVGLCLALVTVIMLVAIKMVVPDAVDAFARTPTIQTASELLGTVQSTRPFTPWVVGSMMSILVGAGMAIWLAITWPAYRLALGLRPVRSWAALAMFALLFLGPVGLLIWTATVI
jgi:hypothetical protein